MSHAERLAAPEREAFPFEAIANRTPDKPWYFSFGHGGSSNCWGGNTPRFLPSDFRLRSTWGVGEDWPIAYDDLEEHYCDAEELMGVAGSSRYTPFPRSRPYPLPPHRMTDPDYALARAFPDAFFALPCARPTRPVPGRSACCASMRCGLCPVDSKFTITNGMRAVYADPRVEVRYGARATALEHEAGRVRGVRFESASGREEVASGEFVALGANAIFNAHLLLASGLDGGGAGSGLVEQVGITVDVDLAGMESFQGSTVQTGHGYMLHDGPHRAERAAALIESSSSIVLRDVPHRWRQRHRLHVIFEDLPRSESCVRFDPRAPERPVVEFRGISSYARKGLDALADELPRLLAALPVEGWRIAPKPRDSEYHVQGGCVMGDDPTRSVVDRHCVHHAVRNLAVLGASAFPTCPPSNPTLTVAALSLWSARRIYGGTPA